MAATWYAHTSFTIDLNLNDANPPTGGLLFGLGRQRADPDGQHSGATSAMLNSQNLSSFQNGKYLVWNLTGHVILR